MSAPFFSKCKSQRCRLCKKRACRHGWKPPADPVFASLCEDHEGLAGFAQVLLNTWTTSITLGRYDRATLENQAAWLAEMTTVMTTPPATVDGLVAVTLKSGSADIADVVLDGIARSGARVWITPEACKHLHRAGVGHAQAGRFADAVRLSETSVGRVPCSDAARVNILRCAAETARHSKSTAVLDIFSAALRDYPDAPLAAWHGLGEEQLSELRCWMHGEPRSTDAVYTFLDQIAPEWRPVVPFTEPAEWSAAWHSRGRWKASAGGISIFVAETAAKPSMVLSYLLANDTKMCSPAARGWKASGPVKAAGPLEFFSPYEALFSRVAELGADEVVEAARVLHRNLPHNHFPGFQELPQHKVKLKLSGLLNTVFCDAGFPRHVQVGPCSMAATYIHDDNRPWLAYSSRQAATVTTVPLDTVPPERLNGFVFAASPGSIVERPLAVKTALQSATKAADARKLVAAVDDILPQPRAGWTADLFNLSPAPASAVALLNRGESMEHTRQKWCSGTLTREQKEANCIIGLLYRIGGAKLLAFSQLGQLCVQFINDACGGFTPEDIWVDRDSGSISSVAATLFPDAGGQVLLFAPQLTAHDMPTLALAALFAATFISDHPGNLRHGTEIGARLEQVLAEKSAVCPHIKKLLEQKPELERPGLWFTKYAPRNTRYYPKHINDAVVAAICAIRRVSRAAGVPDLPPEIILIILEAAGTQAAAIGRCTPFDGGGDTGCALTDDALVDWACFNARVVKNGVFQTSNWL